MSSTQVSVPTPLSCLTAWTDDSYLSRRTVQAISFTSAITHWFWSSYEQPSCVFAPGSAEDVSVALQIIGATKTPFAVQSGGHSSNPGFSSTKGVHISLKRLDQVKLSEDKSVAEIGFGNVSKCRWYLAETGS